MCRVTGDMPGSSGEEFEVFLRQHYLDQVPGSAALPRRPLSLCPALRDRLAPRMNGNLGCFAHSVKPAKIGFHAVQNSQCKRAAKTETGPRSRLKAGSVMNW
jgi:hypothetical protein